MVIGKVKVSHVNQKMSIFMLAFENDESCFSQPHSNDSLHNRIKALICVGPPVYDEYLCLRAADVLIDREI